MCAAVDKLYRETAVGDILVLSDVVTALTTDTVSMVLKKLSTAHVHSLPIVKPDLEYVGMVDYLDLVAHLCKVATDGEESSASPASTHLTTDDMHQLMHRAAKFELESVEKSSVANLSVTNPTAFISSGSSLTSALELLGKGLHRIIVVSHDDDNNIIGVLTQSMVNSWISEDPVHRLGAVAEATPESLGLLDRPIPKVAVDAIAIDAFLKMHKHYEGALVVVDEEDRCRGVLSATDLKYISDFRFDQLLLPVGEFLESVRRAQAIPTKVYICSVSPSTMMADVMTKMSHERVHRVVVTDEEGRAVGLVSLSNVIKCMHNYLHPKEEEEEDN